MAGGWDEDFDEGDDEPIRPDGKDGKKSIATKARRFLASMAPAPGATGLVETPLAKVYRYNGRHWQQMRDATLNAELRRFLGLGVSMGEFHLVRATVLAIAHDSEHAWGEAGETEIACDNGMLDAVSGVKRAHHWADWLETVLPVVWTGVSAAQGAPLWHKALETWFTDAQGNFDMTAHDALQEFFGYVCLGHARFKKALLVVGPGDSGKSVALKVLTALVSGSPGGGPTTCSLDPHLMDEPKHMAVIQGKRLNVVTELSEGRGIAAAGFKKLVSTEEPVYIDEKNVAVTTYVSRAKHAFGANALPYVNDRIRPVLNRLLIVHFPRSVPRTQRIEHLAERIAEQELEGVLAWAVEGARRLIENGGTFTEPAEQARLLDEIEAESNPVPEFVAERLVEREDARLPVSEILPVFNRWQGGRAWTVARLGRKLREAGYRLEKQRPPTSAGRPSSAPVSCLIGWELPSVEGLGQRQWSGEG